MVAPKDSSRPDWDCILDGSPSSVWVMRSGTGPNRISDISALCWAYDLSDEDHTFEMRAQVDQNQTLWVDKIRYQASVDVNVSTAWTEVEITDTRYEFSSGWIREEGMTRMHNASFVYQFDGVFFSFTLYFKVTSTRLWQEKG